MRGIEVEVRPFEHRHLADDRRAQGDLDPLHRIQAEQAQLAIEVVEGQDVAEGRPRHETAQARRGIGLLERPHVAEQPVVADVFQCVKRLDRIGDRQATLNGMGQKGRKRERGLGVGQPGHWREEGYTQRISPLVRIRGLRP